MSTDLRKTLKNNLPEFLKTYPSLLEFLDAAGEFLNETKDEIEAFDYSHDYQKSSRFALDSSLKSIGFEIPPYISEKVSRTVLRDAMQSFIRKGTTDSLLWVLKIIGTTPTIRQAWLPSPNEVDKGQKINLETGEKERYDISEFTYTDFLYGDAVTTDNGTYFKGYRYDDVFEENVLDNIPIIGEDYKSAPDYLTPVEKMPYIIVRISDQNFNVATEPYVDPETGETYEYGVSEEYRAVEALIEYFLYDTARPANVRVIVVSSIQNLDDQFGVRDTLTQDNWQSGGTYDSDNTGFSDTDSQELESSITQFNIGDPIILGDSGSPYESQFQLIHNISIGEGGDFVNELYNSGFLISQSYTAPYNMISGGIGHKIPVRIGTTLTVTPDVDIEIHGLNHFSDAIGSGTLLSQVNNGITENLNIGVDYHAIYIKTVSGSDAEITITVNYT